ncbi:hypothetical protein DKE52_016995 [Acinetobacter pittii]|uniref:Uncharacterized protein n=1 Tax=Acinetobacter pittii TaxID=48296 RepID=A0A3G6YMR8_ACIPI|nr:hypothetical protein DKE52_016995 [Acinetobacter pittii]
MTTPPYKTTIKNITDKRIPVKNGINLVIFLFSLKNLPTIKIRKKLNMKRYHLKKINHQNSLFLCFV